ncbi:hypothetical protein MATL_G00149440 [Megalops atlanticus]|uniref:CFAP47-like immunoglobulin-like domain-containing protein n=1 Tax=Megalops atlanticus TaxID=7932 RepID=A0A9D3T8N3_MEGAT|nr:hypothetical protein MATL_G00149440 [Megalops atlanticus]
MIEYSVEVSMPEHFLLPETVSVPVAGEGGDSARLQDGQVVLVPMQFRPKAAGRYQCQVVLRSWQDVRVHLLEAVVRGEGSHAQLEFTAPAHQSVTQDIPLNSESLQDCRLRCILSGQGFSGPPLVYIHAGARLYYPLTFHPTSRCIVTGHLSLINDTDGTEYRFDLRGVGERPLALEHVQIHCTVREVTQSRLQVPNYSQKLITCQVVSDLSIVSGPPTLEIKPGHTVPYTISVSPWKRGMHKGVISFVAQEKEMVMEKEKGGCGQPAPDSKITPDQPGEMTWPYEVWFSLEVISSPAPPMKVLPVQCAVHSSVAVEIPITNPRAEPLQLQVCVEGPDLSGDTWMSVPAHDTQTYLARFSPATTGKKTGSVIFQSDVVGEFWHQLDLVADPPVPITLPDCSCELGKWTRTSIPLINPTDERLELDAVNSNPRNFTLELDGSQALIVEPHSTTQVPVQFCPSSLGRGNHTARVCFTCAQLGEWSFLLSGTGLAPGLMEPLSVSSRVGSHSSLFLPFRNPMEHDVLVHIFLTDEEPSLGSLNPSVQGTHEYKGKAFTIPLRKTQGVLLAPEASVDVPVVFAPESMQRYSAWVVIQLESKEGQSWRSEALEDSALRESGQQGRSLGGQMQDLNLQEIRWVYPIHGIPEAVLGPSHPAVIRCEARSRVEERLEVQLTGCVPGPSAPPVARDQSVSPRSKTPTGPGSRSLQEDFLYEIRFENDEEQAQLDNCVALSLLGCEREPQSGIVTLTFNFVLTPCRPLRCTAVLAIQSITGGLWKFPITLISTEPQVDDVITIEAAGLNKTSGVVFRLTSLSRHPEPFTAKFLPGSGPEFQVCPHSGELLPVDSPGTLFTITFRPTMYSKRHRATLLVQTADMQWTYEVNGALPLYTPPSSRSSQGVGSTGLRPTRVCQRNFLRENLQVPSMAASSPLRDHPLIPRVT